MGYNAWNNNHWSVDVIGTQLNDDIVDSDNDELKGLRKRDPDFLVGGRTTAYYGNTILQLQLLGDISDTHDGVVASLEGGHNWQLRNWNLHTLLGVRYHTNKVVDYYLGVRQEEASAKLPEYKAGAGSLFLAEFGVTYPITEHWVFRSTALYEKLSHNLNQSPLISRNYGASLSTTFSYVF